MVVRSIQWSSGNHIQIPALPLNCVALEKSFKLPESQFPFPLNDPQTCLGSRAFGGCRTLACYQEYIYSILDIILISITYT